MLKDLYYYKSNAEDVFNRMNRLYDDAYNHRGGNILFRVLLQSDIDVYTRIKINKYNYEIEADKYSRDLCDILFDSFEARLDVLDDAIPSLSVNLGIGDYSAFVTGDIYFSNDTSWSRPTLKNLRDFRNIEPLGTAPWYKKFLQICEYIMINTKSSGIPFARGFFSPLDLAEALRGQDIYTDFYDDPDGVHELLGYCADATIKFAEDIYSIAKKYAGNEKYSMWFMDGSINMSEDIACMISANTYREFAAPHTQRVINHFGKGFMHTHSRAMYMVKEICRLDNVVNLWLATDPNQPRPIDCLERLVEDANGVCMAIDCLSMDEIEKNMKIALKGNVSFCLPVENIQEGITSVKKFKELTEKTM